MLFLTTVNFVNQKGLHKLARNILTFALISLVLYCDAIVAFLDCLNKNLIFPDRNSVF